ncbi:hypothetical protein [Streptomyces sp. L2]|uniref:hypothetical protein n=1 Tax=Streptomyces sp. L2 TaxID=2162665 RepID=UPI0013E91F51|nr:hypothetical protein [Streptomyces sp. L2]
MIAATLVQHPRYVDCADSRWDENAAFIAMAREAVPKLVPEVKYLRELLSEGHDLRKKHERRPPNQPPASESPAALDDLRAATE